MITSLFSHWLRYLYVGAPALINPVSKHRKVNKNVKKMRLKRKHLRNIQKESRRRNRPK